MERQFPWRHSTALLVLPTEKKETTQHAVCTCTHMPHHVHTHTEIHHTHAPHRSDIAHTYKHTSKMHRDRKTHTTLTTYHTDTNIHTTLRHTTMHSHTNTHTVNLLELYSRNCRITKTEAQDGGNLGGRWATKAAPVRVVWPQHFCLRVSYLIPFLVTQGSHFPSGALSLSPRKSCV